VSKVMASFAFTRTWVFSCKAFLTKFLHYSHFYQLLAGVRDFVVPLPSTSTVASERFLRL